MIKSLLATGLLLVSFTAQAQLAQTFKKLDGNRKGPFGLNMLQGSRSRVVVNQGNPTGTYQFQAAFRNEIAQEMAAKYGFFTANLFTTNYYELQGEFVYGSIYSSHDIDHKALLAAAPQAFPKAAAMVRSWVLEKHYIHAFPASAIVRGFKLRGISGAEFEQPYAYHFFNFYMSSMNEDRQFLPAFLLTKGSPIASSSSLERARTLIAACYEEMSAYFGTAEPGIKRLYDIRNIVHNQVSKEVLKMIDQYSRDYASLYQQDGRIAEVRSILASYFSINATEIVDQAKKLGLKSYQDAASAVVKGGSPERYLALSEQMAGLRAAIADNNQVPYEKKTDSLVLIYMTSQFLNKEIANMNSISSKDVIKTAVNLVYSEGFLIKDNWQYFLSEVDGAANVSAAAATLPDIVGIATDTLTQAFAPTYDQWVSVEPKMAYFMDNTIKSSSLNTISLIVKKIKK